MVDESRIINICAAINKEVDRIMRSVQFRTFFEAEKPRQGNLIVFNNSFLYREGIKTVKNPKYLCVRVGESGPSSPAFITDSVRINSRFKRITIPNDEVALLQTIENGVESELHSTGLIVRVLSGKIEEDEPAQVKVDKVKDCNQLRYEPSQLETAEITSGVVSINRLDDVDFVWKAIESKAAEISRDLADNLAELFESKFAELRESALRPVDINTSDASSSILGEAITHIDQQITAYSVALSGHKSDPDNVDSLNDLLRIAYNFADGAQELMKLIIGVSDMKPIVFWLTFGAQSDLADRFAELPFSLVGKAKPSLERYRSVIARARNQTFHNIFAFSRPFRVRLTGDAFRAPELRLFREYASRRDPALDYADRKLVELLEGFTRTSESPVPLGFWETNLDVMQAVATTVRSLRDALLTIVMGE